MLLVRFKGFRQVPGILKRFLGYFKGLTNIVQFNKLEDIPRTIVDPKEKMIAYYGYLNLYKTNLSSTCYLGGVLQDVSWALQGVVGVFHELSRGLSGTWFQGDASLKSL